MVDPRPPREGLGSFVDETKALRRKVRELSAPTASQRGSYGARIEALEAAVAALQGANVAVATAFMAAAGPEPAPSAPVTDQETPAAPDA